jgi:DsbC/DsbD-like thiol-disulfide interchange protein
MKENMKKTAALLTLALVPFLACAQKKLGEAVTVKKVEIKGELKPRGEVTAQIKLEIDKGYHVHSNKPSEPNFIPTVLALTPAAGVTVVKTDYPAGKSEKVEGLDKPLSVYDHEFEVSVRFKLMDEVKLPVTVPATLAYQACKGATCFRPQRLSLDITIPAGK